MAEHRHSSPVKDPQEDILRVYAVVYSVSGQIPLCHEENGEAPL